MNDLTMIDQASALPGLETRLRQGFRLRCGYSATGRRGKAGRDARACRQRFITRRRANKR